MRHILLNLYFFAVWHYTATAFKNSMVFTKTALKPVSHNFKFGAYCVKKKPPTSRMPLVATGSKRCA